MPVYVRDGVHGWHVLLRCRTVLAFRPAPSPSSSRPSLYRAQQQAPGCYRARASHTQRAPGRAVKVTR